ncbi:hypothetical protein COU91_02905 [Candidatus Saccharibacteria bacterium CG10_big_fil_rev_8_21_14_0_10_47_8]|nr:MAG: hypothetical protein COU91_02905 [Candidatus Saccharibacteria bacterium CG10_big_fil_rev_8_21_14_0_10_47_8]
MVNVVLYGKKPGSDMLKRSFTFVDMHKVKLKERESFVLVDKKSLDEEVKKSDVLFKIVEEYRDERGAMLR